MLRRVVEHAAPEDPRREHLQANLAAVLVMTGRRGEAVRLAERVLPAIRDAARAAEMSFMLAWALHDLRRHDQALIAAHRDDEATADAHVAAMADQLVVGGVAAGYSSCLVAARAVLAERRGQPAQALAVLVGMLDSAGTVEPSRYRPFWSEVVRLALATGDLATARSAAEAAAAGASAGGTRIAAELFLSRRTIEAHVSRILTKLAARSRVEIAREAVARRPSVPDAPSG